MPERPPKRPEEPPKGEQKNEPLEQEAVEESEEPELTPMEKWKFERRIKEGKGSRWLFWAPEHIEDFWDAKEYLFWMPTRRDIEKILAVAVTVHEGSDDPIRILDVGGGGGFLDKLIIDVAREQGMNVECVVIDPAVEVLREARAYYQERKETQLTFVGGTIREHPEIAEQVFDVVLNSWMWGDLRKDIQSIPAKARVYVADRLGSTGSGVDDGEIEDSYVPESGFQDFGSWPVIDHESIKSDGYHNKITSCQTLVQLSDRMLLERGSDLEQQLKDIDAKSDEQLKRFPWEESLEGATDDFFAHPDFVDPTQSKRQQMRAIKMRKLKKKVVAQERNVKWWKFRRGGTGDWKKRYEPTED